MASRAGPAPDDPEAAERIARLTIERQPAAIEPGGQREVVGEMGR